MSASVKPLMNDGKMETQFLILASVCRDLNWKSSR